MNVSRVKDRTNECSVEPVVPFPRRQLKGIFQALLLKCSWSEEVSTSVEQVEAHDVNVCAVDVEIESRSFPAGAGEDLKSSGARYDASRPCYHFSEGCRVVEGSSLEKCVDVDLASQI